jgi:hypothetical protein
LRREAVEVAAMGSQVPIRHDAYQFAIPDHREASKTALSHFFLGLAEGRIGRDSHRLFGHAMSD